MLEEEWECPVGLTKEHAICVDSSSDDDEGDHVTCNDNPIKSDEDVREDGATVNRVSSTSSNFKDNAAQAQESITESSSRIMANLPISSDPKRGTVSSTSDECNESNNEVGPPLTQTRDDSNNHNDNDNPFAAFAFNAGATSSSTLLTSWQNKKRRIHIPTSSSTVRSQTKKVKHIKKAVKQTNSKQSRTIAELQTHTANTEEGEQFEKEEHRQQLIKKWHSFSDSNAPTEERRFQVLIAARIHARCQEPIVHKAMLRLREYFAEREANDGTAQSLSAQCLAQCDPENDIAPLLSSVLFGNVKAQHIVQAAQDVLSKFRGQVPEAMASLQDITGIGPKLSEILNIVNRRETYGS